MYKKWKTPGFQNYGNDVLQTKRTSKTKKTSRSG